MWLEKYKWFRKLSGGEWHYNKTIVPDGLKYQFGAYTFKWGRKWYHLYHTHHTTTIVSEYYFNFKLIREKEWKYTFEPSHKMNRKFSFVNANYQDLKSPRPWDNDPFWPF